MWSYARGSPGESRFGSASTAEDVTVGLSLKDYTAIVTGATAGIGMETARVLAKRGARVILAIRNLNLGEAVKMDFLKENPGARVLLMHLDLSDLMFVRKFAAEFKESTLPLNILVNNGGIALCEGPKNTLDGLELMFATNFLGHFLLTDLLLDTMKATAKESGTEGRIVIVSGAIYNFTPESGIAFDKLINTNDRKLAGILHCRELAVRLKDKGAHITVNTLHPGAIRTKLVHLDGFLGFLSDMIPSIILKNLEQGAATQVYVATNPQLNGVTGKYFVNCSEFPLGGNALDIDLQRRLGNGQKITSVLTRVLHKYDLLSTWCSLVP